LGSPDYGRRIVTIIGGGLAVAVGVAFVIHRGRH
jgi:hypothetical protein